MNKFNFCALSKQECSQTPVNGWLAVQLHRYAHRRELRQFTIHERFTLHSIRIQSRPHSMRRPPSASVRRRTAGQSSPMRRRRGLPGRLGSPGSGARWTHSYLPGPAIGGVPGPPEWTSSDRGTMTFVA